MNDEEFIAFLEENPQFTDAEINELMDLQQARRGEDAFSVFRGGLEAALQGPTFNWSDEIGGAVAAVPALIPGGETYPEAYRRNTDAIRRQLAGFHEQNPILAPGMEIGAGVLGGGILGGLGKRIAPPFYANMSQWAKALTGGTASGAAAGAGASTEETVGGVMKDTGYGAGFGAFMSPVMSAGGRMLTRLGSAGGKLKQKILEGAGTKADRMAGEILEESELPETEFNRRMNRLGPEGLFADANQATIRNLRDLVADDAGLHARAKEQLMQRAAGGRSRLTQAAAASMGVPDRVLSMELRERMAERSANANRNYGPIYNTRIQPTEDLLAVLSRPKVRQAYRDAQDMAGLEGDEIPRMMDDDGNMIEIPTVKMMDWLKMALEDQVLRYTKPDGKVSHFGRSFLKAKNDLLAEMDKTPVGDQYRLARSEYAGESAIIDAMQKGENIFNEKAERTSFDLSQMGSSEFEAYQLGAFNAVRDEIDRAKSSFGLSPETMSANTAATRNKFSTPLYMNRLKNAFPSDENFGEFVDALDRELAFQNTINSGLYNSTTALTLEGVKRMNERLTGTAPRLEGGGLTESVVNFARNAITEGAPDDFNRAVKSHLADIALSTSGADFSRIFGSGPGPTKASLFNPYAGAATGLSSQVDPDWLSGFVGTQ